MSINSQAQSIRRVSQNLILLQLSFPPVLHPMVLNDSWAKMSFGIFFLSPASIRCPRKYSPALVSNHGHETLMKLYAEDQSMALNCNSWLHLPEVFLALHLSHEMMDQQPGVNSRVLCCSQPSLALQKVSSQDISSAQLKGLCPPPPCNADIVFHLPYLLCSDHQHIWKLTRY